VKLALGGVVERLIRGCSKVAVATFLRTSGDKSISGPPFDHHHHVPPVYTPLALTTKKMRSNLLTPLFSVLILLLSTAVSAQGFFEQFFSGGGPQHQGPPQNAPSDAKHYAEMFDASMLSTHTPLRTSWATRPLYSVCNKPLTQPPPAHCTNYLCPGTLACVHFAHHCPCAYPEVEDKVELAEGIAICASKGGYREGEMLRKVELARKGLL